MFLIFVTSRRGDEPRHYVRIRSGRCNSDSGHPLYNFINSIKDSHQDGATRPFVLVIDMAREFARQFYSSAAWQSCRNEYIKSAHYLCEDCMKRGIYKPAKEVHHIEELTPENIHRPEIALSFDNLVALCKDCHKARHSEREKNKRYVFGPGGEIILK